MNEAVIFEKNMATIAEVAVHLLQCDAAFVPPLSQRVLIGEYAKKLVQLSVCFEARANKVLVGLVSAYCNDPSHKVAFISSVSVLDEWRHQGIASTLIEQCRLHAIAQGFDSIELEVARDSAKAATLYAKLGFQNNLSNHDPMRMSLPISHWALKSQIPRLG